MVYAVSYVGRMNMAIAIPSMKEAGVATLGELGLAGSLYFWCYGYGHLVNGILGDHFPTRFMVFLGLMFSCAANLGIALFPSRISIQVLWCLNGFSLSMLWGPLIRLLGERVPAGHHSTASLLMSLSIGAGTFMSWNFLGRAIEHSGNWRIAFFIPFLTSALMAVLWLFICPPSHMAQSPVEPLSSGAPAPKEGFLSVFFRTRLYLIVVVSMVQGIVKDGLTLWLPAIMKSRFPDTPAISLVNGLSLIPLINTLGILSVALLLKRRQFEYRRWAFLLLGVATGVVFLLGRTFFPFAGTLACFSALSLVIALVNSILLGMVPMQYKKSGRVSTVAGMLDFSAYMAAGVFSFFSGRLFRGSGDWSAVLSFLFISLTLGALLILFAKRRIES